MKEITLVDLLELDKSNFAQLPRCDIMDLLGSWMVAKGLKTSSTSSHRLESI